MNTSGEEKARFWDALNAMFDSVENLLDDAHQLRRDREIFFALLKAGKKRSGGDAEPDSA